MSNKIEDSKLIKLKICDYIALHLNRVRDKANRLCCSTLTFQNVKGGTLAKSRKLFFQGRPFLEGKIQKMQKKISKIFIVPNRSLGHTDHLYTYKGHIEHVGFT